MSLIAVTEDTLAETISSNKVVVVDFWAPWCGPCKALAPILDKLAAEFSGRITFTKVDVDERSELASQYGIRSVPSVVIVNSGQVVDKWSGMAPEATWRARLAEHAA